MKITLTSYSMGDIDQADFDAWLRYVCEHVDEACGVLVAEVDQFRMGTGHDRDVVEGGTEEERARVLEWLAHGGWDAFCADPAAWPAATATA